MTENNFLPPETNHRQRILVVDDDPQIRQLNAEVLACHGYEAVIAADGIAAWDEVQLNHYDLLITDNEMPRLSGLELVRRLQNAHQALPVIMLTGNSPHEELARQPELQIEAVLLKPYTIDELLNAVKNVLHASNAGRMEIAPPNWQRPSNDAGQRPE